MRLGVIARCDSRGLGHMTWELCRAMRPDRVLVVMLDPVLGKDFVQRVGRYQQGSEWTDRMVVATWAGGPLPEDAVADFLDGLDVVYSAETFYDPGFVLEADRRGVATCLHVMPEFYRADLPRPTATWLPTSWRADITPHDAVVPVPVALDRFPAPLPDPTGPVSWLHVAGNRAAHDRNGTAAVLAGLRSLRHPATVTVTCQRGALPALPARRQGRARVVYEDSGTPDRDYWELYAGHHALVMPRRYGGLCLPAQEAMAAGMAVVMPDVEPNREWPVVTIPARRGGVLRTSAGLVDVATIDGANVARVMDELADPVRLWEARSRALLWAAEHSWDALAPMYRERFAAMA